MLRGLVILVIFLGFAENLYSQQNKDKQLSREDLLELLVGGRSSSKNDEDSACRSFFMECDKSINKALAACETLGYGSRRGNSFENCLSGVKQCSTLNGRSLRNTSNANVCQQMGDQETANSAKEDKEKAEDKLEKANDKISSLKKDLLETVRKQKQEETRLTKALNDAKKKVRNSNNEIQDMMNKEAQKGNQKAAEVNAMISELNATLKKLDDVDRTRILAEYDKAVRAVEKTCRDTARADVKVAFELEQGRNRSNTNNINRTTGLCRFGKPKGLSGIIDRAQQEGSELNLSFQACYDNLTLNCKKTRDTRDQEYAALVEKEIKLKNLEAEMEGIKQKIQNLQTLAQNNSVGLDQNNQNLFRKYTQELEDANEEMQMAYEELVNSQSSNAQEMGNLQTELQMQEQKQREYSQEILGYNATLKTLGAAGIRPRSSNRFETAFDRDRSTIIDAGACTGVANSRRASASTSRSRLQTLCPKYFEGDSRSSTPTTPKSEGKER